MFTVTSHTQIVVLRYTDKLKKLIDNKKILSQILGKGQVHKKYTKEMPNTH